jgi:hypothetical protein
MSDYDIERRDNETDEEYLKRVAPSLFCPIFGATSAARLVGTKLAEKLIWKITEFEIFEGRYPDKREICELAVEIVHGDSLDPDEFARQADWLFQVNTILSIGPVN